MNRKIKDLRLMSIPVIFPQTVLVFFKVNYSRKSMVVMYNELFFNKFSEVLYDGIS